MLESITIKGIATYDASGIKVDNLKKINFIYGGNGCGKTTLTKLIYDPGNINYKECFLQWKSGAVVKALIYNKDFRDRNFGKGKMDGVFTLGQATKEHVAAIEKMQIDSLVLKEEGIKKKDTLEKQKIAKQAVEDEFREAVWNKAYKSYESDFKDAFVGYMKKDTFRGKMITEFKINTSNIETYHDLKEKAKIIFGEMPISMPFITILDFSQILKIEKDKIWQKKIIGKDDIEIASLIKKLNLNDWVNEGRSYLQEDNICPFCQTGTITKDFREQLEKYFDESFTKDVATVKSYLEEYNRHTQNALNFFTEIETREKSNEKTKLNIESFSVLLKTLTNQFLINRELLNNKMKEPSRTIELVSIKEQSDSIALLINQCNEEIKKQNDIVNDFSNQKSKLISAIWKFLVEKERISIVKLNSRVAGIQKGIDSLERKVNDLRDEYSDLLNKIREANKNVTSVQPSVDEINCILKSYGFLNFEIIPSKTEVNQYQIQRKDGTIAESTLSEGEVTFITFLYFLQLAKGNKHEESISEERILLIDDPISSLDSNILFVVSSLIKDIMKQIKNNVGNIKQLILLTHNVYFHKEVSFIDGRTKTSSDTNFWILRRNKNVSSIQYFGSNNPIQNSYELLWKELCRSQNNSGITIQNTMRRILENYFKVLGGHNDEEIIQSFINYEEQEVCRSLISWINDGSHSIPDDLYIEQQDAMVETYFEVFKKIFLQMGHEKHYNMMYRVPGVAELTLVTN